MYITASYKNSFIEALRSDRIKEALVTKDCQYIKDLEKKNIKYKIVDKKKLDILSKNGNHQGCLAYTKEYKLATVKSMMKKEKGLIVLLDGLKDPHNLGAIIRTCECAGADGLVYKNLEAGWALLMVLCKKIFGTYTSFLLVSNFIILIIY